MVATDFCSTNNTFECLLESAFGIIPIIAFIIFGYYSYRETRARTAYVRQSYTFRHLSKIILSSVIATLSLAFVIIYVTLEPEISLKTALTYAMSAVVWGVNSLLIRWEYKSLGYTTNYLRYAWIIMLVCQTALIIFAAAGANTDSFGKVAAIYIINDLAILAIIIVGYSYADDYPPQQSSEAYGSLMSDSSIDIGEEHYRNLSASPLDRPIRSKEDGAFKPFAETPDEEAGSRRGRGSLRRVDGSQNSSFEGEPKANPSRLMNNNSLTVSLKDDIRLLESVEVKGYEETKRLNKTTIVYTINYVIKGQQFSTKRSYSEFVEIREQAKKEKPGIKFPKIPGKKAIGKTKDDESLAVRADAFDKLLKMILKEKVAMNYLAVFLSSPSVLPYYGKGKKVNDEAKNVATPTASPMKPEKSKNEVKAKVLDAPAGRAIIPDYTQSDANRSQNMSPTVKYYVVETLDAFENEGSTFYKLNIRDKDSGVEFNIAKRYSEFKAFHEDLRRSLDSADRKGIPELPYKDNVKGFAWRDNPKVIEFRKVALKTYLQSVLNDPKLQNKTVVKNFIRA